MLDHLLADGFGRSDDHSGDAQLEKRWCASANTVRVVMPARIHPRRQIQNRYHAGMQRQVGHGKVGAMEQRTSLAVHFTLYSPEPPSSLHYVPRQTAAK